MVINPYEDIDLDDLQVYEYEETYHYYQVKVWTPEDSPPSKEEPIKIQTEEWDWCFVCYPPKYIKKNKTYLFNQESYPWTK